MCLGLVEFDEATFYHHGHSLSPNPPAQAVLLLRQNLLLANGHNSCQETNAEHKMWAIVHVKLHFYFSFQHQTSANIKVGKHNLL